MAILWWVPHIIVKVVSSAISFVPIPFRQLDQGPEVSSVNDAKPTNRFLGLWKRNIVDALVPNSKYSALPYDSYCPSVKTKVTKRVCKKCDIYYPSIAALKWHREVCSSRTDTVDKESSDEEVEQITEVEMKEQAPIMNIWHPLFIYLFVYVFIYTLFKVDLHITLQ